VEVPEVGAQFLADLHGHPVEEFIQCSYNGSIRGVYPGAGFTYDEELDEFIAPAAPIEDAVSEA